MFVLQRKLRSKKTIHSLVESYYKSYHGMSSMVKIIDVLVQNTVIIKMWLNKNAAQRSIVILYLTLQ